MAHTELSLRERRTIEDMLNAKMSVDKIAAEIGRHRSTVFREIKRNRFVDHELPKLNGYYGMNAQRSAMTRRARRRKLVRFVPSESTFSYFEALESYLLKYGRPVAFYSDKHTVFRVAKPNQHMTGMTQFGRALAELNIEILCANSSQAKGRVERANRTLQDRLVKELRPADISSIEEGNLFLPGFIERYNAKFAKAPARSDNLHRALNIAPDRLSEVFCLRDKRHVTKDLMLKYDRKRIKLTVNDLTRDLAGTYVDVYELADGRVQVRAKGVALPYTIMNPERRITHAAITENKHLSAVLAHIKEEQDKAAPKPKVKPVSAKNGYVKNGRSPGRPSKLELYYAAKRAAAAQTGSES